MSPTLKTERLVMRPPVAHDASMVAAIWREPAVARMVVATPIPQPAIAAEGWLMLLQATAGLQRDFVFSIDHAERGMIGIAGAHVRKSGVELGYSLHPEHWGFGFGSEAVAALTGFAAGLGCGPVLASVYVDNPASARVLEKTGFAAVGEPFLLYSLGRGQRALARRLRWMGARAAGEPQAGLAAAS